MTNEQAKKMADEALDRLMEELEAGKSEALKAYLAVMGRFHRYSWGNALLIASQRPTATRIAGFHAWLKLRPYVRKGEKGIVILAPITAFVVANAIGLDTNSACSDYIQLHAGGKETLSESLAFIQQTAAEILNVVMPSH